MVKVERSFPAPESLETEALKANGSYSKPDVTKRLSEDFHNKCYICEIGDLQDPEVEHLLPHKNRTYPERVFDWNNLFWACGHCNNVKKQQKYDDGIIDCCKVDPETLIYFGLRDDTVDVYAYDGADGKSALTAELVTEVFNLKNTGMRVYKSEMRVRELSKEMTKLYNTIEELHKNPNSKFVLNEVRVLLKRESPFAAFKRNYIRQNKEKYPQLFQYIT